MKIKSTLDGFLLQLLLRSPHEYILKQLFFEIEVNSGRIFTELRIVQASISKNNSSISIKYIEKNLVTRSILLKKNISFCYLLPLGQVRQP